MRPADTVAPVTDPYLPGESSDPAARDPTAAVTDHVRRSWDRETLPRGDEKRQVVQQMFDAIAGRYDLVNRVMTFGLDIRWRRHTVAELHLEPASVVLDLASGTGDLCVNLMRAGYRPISIDLSLGMLKADRSGAPRVQADILRLPIGPAAVDGVTCGFALRNLVELEAFFAELARVVCPGGRIALLDVGIPSNPVIRWGNGIYFGKVVPRIGALLSDGAAYRYLPKSVSYLPPPAAMLAMLNDAGFVHVSHHFLSGGLTQLLVGTRT